MPLDFQTGLFRVEVCDEGHVSLSVLDGDGALQFLAVMAGHEAVELARNLCDVASLDERRIRRVTDVVIGHG